jgi:hypothetical protein
MWKFLAERWDHVKSASAADPEHLDRVLRRRSAIYCSATIRMVAALPRLKCSQGPTRCLI